MPRTGSRTMPRETPPCSPEAPPQGRRRIVAAVTCERPHCRGNPPGRPRPNGRSRPGPATRGRDAHEPSSRRRVWRGLRLAPFQRDARSPHGCSAPSGVGPWTSASSVWSAASETTFCPARPSVSFVLVLVNAPTSTPNHRSAARRPVRIRERTPRRSASRRGTA